MSVLLTDLQKKKFEMRSFMFRAQRRENVIGYPTRGLFCELNTGHLNYETSW
jgi:hypothetical protein